MTTATTRGQQYKHARCHYKLTNGILRHLWHRPDPIRVENTKKTKAYVSKFGNLHSGNDNILEIFGFDSAYNLLLLLTFFPTFVEHSPEVVTAKLRKHFVVGNELFLGYEFDISSPLKYKSIPVYGMKVPN